jgi:threonyl-tRNA synthetase
VALRRLGGADQTVMSLDEAVAALREEATPPDLRKIAM